MRELGLVLVLLLICVGFGATVDGFANTVNLMDRSREWVETGIVAVAMTLIIATGGIDLSVGSMLALSAATAGVLWRSAGVPIELACMVGVAAGVAAGACNGVAICRLQMPPLVVTLATMAAYRGLAIGLTGAEPVRNLPEGFVQIGQGNLGGVLGAVPMQLPLLILVGGVGILALRRSWIGPAALAMGENPVAARFAGLPVGRLTVGFYAASGLMCGLAGVVYLARFGSINPESAGDFFELNVIACVVLGGTRIVGGSASVVGTLLGVLILDLLQFGLELSADRTGLGGHERRILVGVLVIATAALNEWLARRGRSMGGPPL